MEGLIKATYTPITNTPEQGEKPDTENANEVTVVAFDLDGYAIYITKDGHLRRAPLNRFSNCSFALVVSNP